MNKPRTSEVKWEIRGDKVNRKKNLSAARVEKLMKKKREKNERRTNPICDGTSK